MTDAERKAAIEGLLADWRAEIQAAKTYRLLAERERDSKRKQVLYRMAAVEEQHAAKWERRLRELGAEPPPADTIRPRYASRFWQAMGTWAVLRRLEAAEEAHGGSYAEKAAKAPTEEERRELQRVHADERSHARAMNEMAPQGGPRTALDRILGHERWHARSGSWIGDAIYGMNDGLGAVFGLVAGVSGATGVTHSGTASDGHVVLIAGLAGMVASALSMGSGAYLAAKSEREVHEAEVAKEAAELDEHPEEELEELELFYQLKGFTPEEAHSVVERLSQSRELLLGTLVQEELGLHESSLPNPWQACLVATLSTGLGAFLPIIPFFWGANLTAVLAAAGISIAAHFAVGAAKTIVTARSWFHSGLEMTIVGVIEGVGAYAIGTLFNVH